MKLSTVICSLLLFAIPQIGSTQQYSTDADTVTYVTDDDTMQVTPAMLDSIRRSQESAEASDESEVSSQSQPAQSPADGFRYQHDFRGVPWGTDTTTAKSRLNQDRYDREDADALAWYDTIAEDSVYVRLYFYENQFWQASYTYLLGAQAGIQDYNKKFQRIEEVLVKKYGNPDKMRRITWDDSQYIGEVDAIAMGQGLYQSRWFFGDNKSPEKTVTMDLLLRGMNFRPTLVLQYSKPTIVKKVEKAEKDTLIQYY